MSHSGDLFLEVGKVFAAWIQERIEQYGFIEHHDFGVFSDSGNNPKGGRPAKEYAISLDMAKELAMVERNDRGKQARQYFIECERRAKSAASNQMTIPQTLGPPGGIAAGQNSQTYEACCRVKMADSRSPRIHRSAGHKKQHYAAKQSMDASLSSLITGLVSGLGIGTVFTAIVQHAIKQKEATQESLRKDLEARYRVVILLLYAAFDFESNRTTIRINRPDLKDKESVLKELEAEWHNMILFASTETLKSLGLFISAPSETNLLAAAYAMRRDLGRGSVVVELPTRASHPTRLPRGRAHPPPP